MTTGSPFVSRLLASRPDRFEAILQQDESRGVSYTAGLGRQLQVLVRASRAYYILEIGCGSGYTALNMLSALGSTGRIDTIEPDPALAKEAAANFLAFGFSERTRIHTGSSGDVVPGLSGPFDLIVIHGSPAPLADVYEDLVRITRIGGSLFLSDLATVAAEQDSAGGGPASDFVERLVGDPRLATWVAHDLEQALAARAR